MLSFCPEGTIDVIGCMKLICRKALLSLVEDLNLEDIHRPIELRTEASTRKVFPRPIRDFLCSQSLYKRKDVKIPNLNFDDIIVKNAHDVEDEAITNYDQSMYPFERRKYTLSILQDKNGFGKVAFNQNGNVIGIGTTTIYPFGNCTLYPMYGDNERVVQAIFQECLKDVEKTGKNITSFDLRKTESEGCDTLSWIQPFLTQELDETPISLKKKKNL